MWINELCGLMSYVDDMGYCGNAGDADINYGD
jgi:hypothetical protein